MPLFPSVRPNALGSSLSVFINNMIVTFNNPNPDRVFPFRSLHFTRYFYR